MSYLKAAFLASAMTLSAVGGASAAVQQFATATTNLTWTKSGAGGLLNVTNNPVLWTDVQTGQLYSVVMAINGGAGVTTTGLTLTSNQLSFSFAQDFTLSYTFTPARNISGSAVTNLLTTTVFQNCSTCGPGGTDNTGDTDFGAIRRGSNLSSGGFGFDLLFKDNNLFTSDLYRFKNVVDETGAFAFSTITPTYSGAFTAANITALTLQGTTTFSSDPLPDVPEAPSAALLVAGLATVAFASRRRAA